MSPTQIFEKPVRRLLNFQLSLYCAILGEIKCASDIRQSQNVDLDKAMDKHAVDSLKDSLGTEIWQRQLWFYLPMSRCMKAQVMPPARLHDTLEVLP